MNRRHVRRFASLTATGVLALGLTACATTGAPDACADPAPSGRASETVEASGRFDSAPSVTFPTPLYSDGVQATTLLESEDEDAPRASTDQYVEFQLTFLSGLDGTVLSQSNYDEGSAAGFVFDKIPLEGLKQGLECRSEGSRVAITMPVSEAFPEGQTPPGLSEDDTLVVVADITEVVPARAHGTVLPAPSGNYPAVVRDTDGRPGITIPGGEPPADLQIATLVEGDGEQRVEEGDRVLVQYTGVNWQTGEVFDSTWEQDGSPVVLAADEEAVIPGFAKALVGQEVGSQVLAVLPPDEGYGDQQSGAGPAGSTLVFVIDILAVR